MEYRLKTNDEGTKVMVVCPDGTEQTLNEFVNGNPFIPVVAEVRNRAMMSSKANKNLLDGMENAKNLLEAHNIKVDQSSYGYERHKVNKAYMEQELYVRAINNEALAKQDRCPHPDGEIEDRGHDSHYSYGCCKLCGLSIRY